MENKPKTGMSLIVKTITRLIVGLVLLFGIYIVLHGHLSPGGGFSGGVIVALSFVLMMLAFGEDVAVAKISRNLASNLESIGALMFLFIAILGFLGGSFFLNILSTGTPFKLFSAGTIILSNISIGIKVGIGLFAIFLALVILEKTKRER
ncbi:MAG: MnhB domain-containing protein [Candidatus Omnitrophica bacterium]|nr:MnhB domain-containing protein [Candidatus Omnitrophota bacterium]MDD5236618.1 MnhB domain-containing protein [Candidatus Omnitrophota bacterium]MDD5609989.1 MnhB domain-containing protein [Candidatus Omnitrophota bacterium]